MPYPRPSLTSTSVPKKSMSWWGRVPTSYDNTVRQQKLLFRQARLRRFYKELDEVKWYSLWEELSQNMGWSKLLESQQILINGPTDRHATKSRGKSCSRLVGQLSHRNIISVQLVKM